MDPLCTLRESRNDSIKTTGLTRVYDAKMKNERNCVDSTFYFIVIAAVPVFRVLEIVNETVFPAVMSCVRPSASMVG